jgi:FMN-dependent oxidoreductase (nitrilotriacetate monooxygenase family)
MGAAGVTERRYLTLNAFLRNAGYHESAWRLPGRNPGDVLTPQYYIGLAREAERGVLDSLFLADSPGVSEFRSQYLVGAGFDPVELLSTLAAATEHIGLIATVSTTYSYPWDVARRMATLDFLSSGRAGWNVVTTVDPNVAGNFGDTPHPPRADRYESATEYVEVVLKLWDAWDDDAAVMDPTGSDWADPARIHPPRHRGPFYEVEGPLPFPRSPQGHPVLAQAGSSPAGIALAAKYADVVFTPQSDIPAGIEFRARIREQAAGNGRNPDHVRTLPGLSFLIADTEAAAQQLHDQLEDLASSEFRWRNFAGFAGLDPNSIDPDAPFPAEALASVPKSSFAASLLEMATDPTASFRAIAQRFSALPGGLDFVGTPEAMADLITAWWEAGACDGFTVMPNVLPDQLTLFVDQVVPILQRRGIARTEYAGTTLREHMGLGRPNTGR